MILDFTRELAKMPCRLAPISPGGLVPVLQRPSLLREPTDDGAYLTTEEVDR